MQKQRQEEQNNKGKHRYPVTEIKGHDKKRKKKKKKKIK
jgi:hypothetical protein